MNIIPIAQRSVSFRLMSMYIFIWLMALSHATNIAVTVVAIHRSKRANKCSAADKLPPYLQFHQRSLTWDLCWSSSLYCPTLLGIECDSKTLEYGRRRLLHWMFDWYKPLETFAPSHRTFPPQKGLYPPCHIDSNSSIYLWIHFTRTLQQPTFSIILRISSCACEGQHFVYMAKRIAPNLIEFERWNATTLINS